MIKIIITGLVAATASTITLRTTRNNHRIPVEYIPLNGTPSFGGFGVLEIGSSGFYFTPQIASSNAHLAGIVVHPALSVEAQGVSLVNGSYNLTFNRPIRVLNESFANRNPLIHIPAGPGSAFANSCSSFLITPVSEHEDEIIINPMNATEFAFGGEIFYATQIQHPHWAALQNMISWGVRTGIRIISGNARAGSLPNQPADISNDRFVPCAFATDSDTSLILPYQVFGELIAAIEALGVTVSRQPTGVVLSQVTDELLAQFPTIEYLIMSETGEQIHLAELESAQYLTATNEHGGYRFTIFGSLSRFPDFCKFDSRVFGNLLVHFDVQNNRIGFGEPLAEL